MHRIDGAAGITTIYELDDAMKPTTVTAAAVNPVTFHIDCVDHLCRLENKLSDVRGEAGQGPTRSKLDAFMNLLVEITDFSEPRFSPTSFKLVAEKMHDLYQRSKELEEILEQSSWASVKRIFGKNDDVDSEDLALRYAQLQKDFNVFLVEYFVICVKRFSTSSEDKRSFLESVDTLISEVDRIWN